MAKKNKQNKNKQDVSTQKTEGKSNTTASGDDSQGEATQETAVQTEKKQPIQRSETILNNPLVNTWIKNTTTDGTFAERSVLVSGIGSLKSAMLECIASAHSQILLCSFLINDQGIITALSQAAERGVKVYILTASQTVLNKPHGEDMGRKEDHIVFLKLAAKKFEQLRVGDVHAKFIIADPKSTMPNGILSTSNFNQEPLGKNGEAGIKLKGNTALELANLFAKCFWEYADQELDYDGKEIRANKPISTPIVVNTPIYNTFKKDSTLKPEVHKIIAEAKEYLKISSFTFKDQEIFNLLNKKVTEGVKITIIGRKNKLDSIMQKCPSLSYYSNSVIHAKFIISEKEAFLMTANLEPLGLDTGFEAGMYVNQNDALGVMMRFQNDSPLKYEQNFIVTKDNLSLLEDRNLVKESAVVTVKNGMPDFEKIKNETKALSIEVRWKE